MSRLKIIVCSVVVFACHLLHAQTDSVDSLRNLLRIATNDTLRLTLYARIAWAYLAPRVELELGKAYADSVRITAANSNNEKWKMRAHYYYGAYERFKGNHEAAVEYLLPYLSYYRAQGDSNWVADGLFQLANVYNDLGDYPKSIAALHRIISIDRSLNNPRNVAHSLNGVGSAYFEIGRYDAAIKVYHEALAIYDSVGGEANKSSVLLNLGNLYTRIKDFDKAKTFYRAALEIDRTYGIQYGVATDLANIAWLFDGMQQYDSGLMYHLQALKIRETLPNKDDLARSLLGVANGYWYTGEARRAETYYRDALNLAQQIHSKPMMRDAYGGLAELYSKQKSFEKAFTYQALHKQMHDSVLNEESTRHVNELSAKYENEKKNRQIALLEKEKAVQAQHAESESFQKKTWSGIAFVLLLAALVIVYTTRQRAKNQRHLTMQNDQLKEAKFRQQVTELELKALKAQINPHFFFNCMNSINCMILEGESESASRYLTKFSKLVRIVLETSDHNQIQLAQELEVLAVYVQLEELRLKEKIVYTLALDENIDLENTFVPPMILQPFVENAIWHGLMPNTGKMNGQIKVSIKTDGQNLKCTIEDNGVGREKARALQTGAVWKKRSMGMKITEERLRLLNQERLSELILITDLKEHDVAAGTRVDISIPCL
jgi:tetratricopeptide (TPR) repeat protein